MFFKKFLLLFNYSCMPFLPIPPPLSRLKHANVAIKRKTGGVSG